MTPEKKQEPARATNPVVSQGRKAWTPKSPVDVMLQQIARQEKRVAELQHEFDMEKNTLSKLLKAKAVLESS